MCLGAYIIKQKLESDMKGKNTYTYLTGISTFEVWVTLLKSTFANQSPLLQKIPLHCEDASL